MPFTQPLLRRVAFCSASAGPARGSVGSNVRRLAADEGRILASLKQLLRIEQSEKLDQLRHHPCPARLMTGTEPRAVVAVEVLVKQNLDPASAGSFWNFSVPP